MNILNKLKGQCNYIIVHCQKIAEGIMPLWNPIEHRRFCHVHRAMSACVFTDYLTVQKLIEKTPTDSGLTVVVRLNLNDYPIGIKIDKKLLDKKGIRAHPDMPDLNYAIFP